MAPLALGGVCAAPLLFALRPQAPTPVFHSEVAVVRLDVAVTQGGRTVRGLSAEAFEVFDDGVRQQLEGVWEQGTDEGAGSAAVPLEATLALDLSRSVSGERQGALRRAAGAFLDGLRVGDQAALVCFSHQVALLQPLTLELDRVRQALTTAESNGSTALRDAVYAALLSRVPNTNRSAVVVFSDGIDNVSWLSPDAIEDAARRSDVLVYAIIIAPRERTEATAQPLLSRLARLTGGAVWSTTEVSDLGRQFVAALRHIRSRYLLSYTPRRPPSAGWHRVEVRLRGRHAEILARAGYLNSTARP